ncbi:glycoside hydrolase superfamily [Lipomyces chichibuensis]|uniref:glycoside hydrolase superfamily n=1 Tax=Lipomyces chichibuensis TaxID=1546026 RepID=UPI0033438F07
MRRSSLFLAVTAFVASQTVEAVYPINNLAVTPAMGWNNWNAFACSVNEHLLLSTAEKMAAIGLRDAGYEYIVLDDCWSLGRDEKGNLQHDPEKFPHGMKYVAEKLHALGFRFGMYSDAGTYTCARYVGSLGYEKQDAQTFASWDVDYLKYDNCYNEGLSGTPKITSERYRTMTEALKATGRPILYAICNWGEDYPWKWGHTVANSWRMSGDIYDSFDRPDSRCPCTGDEYDCPLPGSHCSVMNILNKAAPVSHTSIPGAWNDLDMLEVGNGGMDDEEYKTHFSMWAALKSPLLMGNDVNVMNAKALSILNNPAVLAVSQDPVGAPAVRRWRYFVNDTDEFDQGEIQMWAGPLYNGDQLVILLNAGNNSRTMTATLADVFRVATGIPKEIKEDWDIYDLWGNRMDDATAQSVIDGSTTVEAGENVARFYYNATKTSYKEGLAVNDPHLLGKFTGTVEAGGAIETEVPRHGVSMLRLRKRSANIRSQTLIAIQDA